LAARFTSSFVDAANTLLHGVDHPLRIDLAKSLVVKTFFNKSRSTYTPTCLTATLHTFPAARIVRQVSQDEGRPTTQRFSAADLEALQRRFPTGRHETDILDDGVTVDRWLVPALAGDVLAVLLITLEPNGDWTVTDTNNGYPRKVASVEALCLQDSIGESCSAISGDHVQVAETDSCES